jgi:FtsH-binding integral membrane protein
MPVMYFLFAWKDQIMSVLPVMAVAALLGLPLLFGARRVRLETGIPVVLVMLLSGAWYIFGFRYAVRYQALDYAVACTVITLGWSVTLVLLWRSTVRSPSQVRTAAFHAVASVWIASYAFPWMGELP